VPISYHGRTYEEGKKIGWKDGLKALGAILYFWVIDDLYVEPYGRAYLNNLTGTPQYVSWMARLLRRHLGDNVLELGAGLGTLTGRLMGRRLRYVACEKDPLYLHSLRNRFLRTPSVEVMQLDPACPMDYEGLEASFDTVLCLNVLEYLEEPEVTVRSAARCLKDGGRLVVLAPQSPALYGSLDKTLGHRRRFRRKQLEELVKGAGLEVEQVLHLNKVASPAWLFNSRILRTRYFGKPALKIFDKTVWLWETIDPILPWPGLTAVVVARKRG
jgi:SAM-dependent methyltransferase